MRKQSRSSRRRSSRRRRKGSRKSRASKPYERPSLVNTANSLGISTNELTKIIKSIALIAREYADVPKRETILEHINSNSEYHVLLNQNIEKNIKAIQRMVEKKTIPLAKSQVAYSSDAEQKAYNTAYNTAYKDYIKQSLAEILNADKGMSVSGALEYIENVLSKPNKKFFELLQRGETNNDELKVYLIITLNLQVDHLHNLIIERLANLETKTVFQVTYSSIHTIYEINSDFLTWWNKNQNLYECLNAEDLDLEAITVLIKSNLQTSRLDKGSKIDIEILTKGVSITFALIQGDNFQVCEVFKNSTFKTWANNLHNLRDRLIQYGKFDKNELKELKTLMIYKFRIVGIDIGSNVNDFGFAVIDLNIPLFSLHINHVENGDVYTIDHNDNVSATNEPKNVVSKDIQQRGLRKIDERG